MFVSAIAVGIGAAGAFIAAGLIYLIGFFTNLFYYGRLAFTFVSPAENQLVDLAVSIPVIGGIAIGFMTKYCQRDFAVERQSA